MKKRLKAKTLAVELLNEKQIIEMFRLFELFYDEVSLERFKNDLKGKHRVILMINGRNQIKGFSTLCEFDYLVGNKNYRILYSGDTIVSPEHWGTSVLTMAFLKSMMSLKLRYPTRPIWWFLISKGYKTYLLLANNFINYYPRHDKKTPKEYKELLRGLSEKLYPGKFNPETGVVEFSAGEHEKLKESVAPITNELKSKFPKIKFFEEMNPNWKKGNELSCIGEIDPRLAFIHPFKILKKVLLKSNLKKKISVQK